MQTFAEGMAYEKKSVVKKDVYCKFTCQKAKFISSFVAILIIKHI
ncbi:hypothetical protein [Campylobacter concisus]|nr:hypothetical protein [Campylobacter concisus]